jgi:hypothetical protein
MNRKSYILQFSAFGAGCSERVSAGNMPCSVTFLYIEAYCYLETIHLACELFIFSTAPGVQQVSDHQLGLLILSFPCGYQQLQERDRNGASVVPKFLHGWL